MLGGEPPGRPLTPAHQAPNRPEPRASVTSVRHDVPRNAGRGSEVGHPERRGPRYGYGRCVPFFEPLPPLPEPGEEQPTGWRPPLWDRPSEASIGAPVPVAALLAKTDRVALALANVAAYPNGFTFEVLIQRNPMAPRRANEHPSLFMGPPRMRRGPRIGFEFGNGTRVVEASPVPTRVRSVLLSTGSTDRDDRGIPTTPILRTQGGGGGSHDRFEIQSPSTCSTPTPPCWPAAPARRSSRTRATHPPSSRPVSPSAASNSCARLAATNDPARVPPSSSPYARSSSRSTPPSRLSSASNATAATVPKVSWSGSCSDSSPSPPRSGTTTTLASPAYGPSPPYGH